MGTVCGCGEKEKVDSREKERIKSLLGNPETKNVLHQIDLVKTQFRKVDERNAHGYFDAFYDVLSAKSNSAQSKLHTVMLLNAALENNPECVKYLKKHPIYPLLCKTMANMKKDNATLVYHHNKLASWQEKYENAVLELVQMTNNKYPGQLPEFHRFCEQNKPAFPRQSSFLKMNTESAEEEFKRLDMLNSILARSRETAVEETMERLRIYKEIKPIGFQTELYKDTVAQVKLDDEDVNKIEMLGLDNQLAMLAQEVQFNKEFFKLIEASDSNDVGIFETKMRQLILDNYPQMIDLVDKNSILENSKKKGKPRMFKEEDLDEAIEKHRENPVQKSGPPEEDYEFDLNQIANRSRSTSKTKPIQNNNSNGKMTEKQRMVQQNSELKLSIIELSNQKKKIQTNIKQQTSVGRLGIEKETLNMTTTKQFNMKTYSMNSSSSDLLRLLNDKELQLDKLKKNYSRLQNTFSEMYDDDEVEKCLKTTNADTEPRQYASKLMGESQLARSMIKANQRDSDLHEKEGREFVGDMQGNIKRFLDTKRSYLLE